MKYEFLVCSARLDMKVGYQDFLSFSFQPSAFS